MDNTPEIGLTNEMEKKSEIKETPQQQQEQKEEEKKNIEEYIESLCKCAIDIARSVVRLFEFYKQVPPEVMRTEPMRRIQEKVFKLLCINLLENNKQSSGTFKQQDSDDPMLSNPEVKDCLEELDKAIKEKRRWLITKVAMQRSGRGVPQESGEIRPPALSEMNPLVIECFREIDNAIEAKRRFVMEMTS